MQEINYQVYKKEIGEIGTQNKNLPKFFFFRLGRDKKLILTQLFSKKLAPYHGKIVGCEKHSEKQVFFE